MYIYSVEKQKKKLKHLMKFKFYSELQISANCSSHLLQRIIQLKRNVVTNSPYHRRDAIEINPVPESLGTKFSRRMSPKLYL